MVFFWGLFKRQNPDAGIGGNLRCPPFIFLIPKEHYLFFYFVVQPLKRFFGRGPPVIRFSAGKGQKEYVFGICIFFQVGLFLFAHIEKNICYKNTLFFKKIFSCGEFKKKGRDYFEKTKGKKGGPFLQLFFI